MVDFTGYNKDIHTQFELSLGYHHMCYACC